MFRSKHFWIGVVIFVPFLIIWITEGFGWAISTLAIVGMIILFVRISLSGGRKRRYYYDDDPDYDEDVYVSRRRPRRRSAIQTGLDWHVPKVNREGAEFITGSRNLRRRQEEETKRIRKNLWGQ